MSKKSRHRPTLQAAEPGHVSPRQPCPCGSGRRYKACHGRPGGAPAPFVARTFAGLPGEADWVALREIVPAATSPITLLDPHTDRQVLLCSLLPMAAPALVRADGAIWLGLQVLHSYGDVSRDLAAALEKAVSADPGTRIVVNDDPGPGARLQDLVDPAVEPHVQTQSGYDFWIADGPEPSPEVASSLEAANQSVAPTERLVGVGAAYWTSMSGREYLRWVLPFDEENALDGLARLHAAGRDTLVEGSRLIGSFRAHGLVVPVWEVPAGTGAAPLQGPAEEVHLRLLAAVAETAPLDSVQRAARSGLATRQVTIR
jgi:Family of unknown function (DUF5926)/SEC-C motif